MGKGPVAAFCSALLLAACTATPSPSAPPSAGAAGAAGVAAPSPGVTFVPRTTAHADLYVDPTFSLEEAVAIASQVDADVEYVETTYGRKFTPRVSAYVLPDAASFFVGLQSQFGLSEADAAAASRTPFYIHVDPTVRKVLMNWGELASYKPIGRIRYRLTAMMINVIGGTRRDQVPVWLGEGAAALEQFSVTGNDWLRAIYRYGAASMAAAGKTLSLAQMTSNADWLSRSGADGEFQTYEAVQVVQFIKNDIGTAGIIRIVELMAQGQTFEGAYATVTGKPLADLSATLSSRLNGLAPAYPGIWTAAGAPSGVNSLSFGVYGFKPGASLSLDAKRVSTGAPFTSVKTLTVDAYGTWWNTLGPRPAADSYVVTATGPSLDGQTATVGAAATCVRTAPCTAVTASGTAPAPPTRPTRSAAPAAPVIPQPTPQGCANPILARTLAPTTTIGGFTFNGRTVGVVDLYAESSIPPTEVAAILSQITADVADIQTTYGRAFGSQIPTYVFARTATYPMGLQNVLNFRADNAQTEAYFPAFASGSARCPRSFVSMNWEAAKSEAPLTTLRHELAHSMQFQIGNGNIGAAWLAEGSSRLEQFTPPGTKWFAASSRYTAVSMTTVGTAIAFSDLQSEADWITRAAHGGGAEYEEAAAIVQLFRDDVGLPAAIKIWELLAQQQTLDAAMSSVLGKPTAAFGSTVASRIAALGQAPGAPGAWGAPDANGDPHGVTFGVYGYKPATQVTWTVTTSLGGVRTFTGTTSADGTQRQAFTGGTWPAGTYKVSVAGTTVSGAATTVTASASKTGP